MMRLTFLGATQTVTGSKYLLETAHSRILIDCGLFQGERALRERNWAAFPVAPHSIDAIVLTHAHMDHSGYIPVLVKHGFRGKIYCTPPTYDLCKILLRDSGRLQEEDARFAIKHKFSRHAHPVPLYTLEDAEDALRYFEPHNFAEPWMLPDQMKVSFSRTGHILGAAFVTIEHEHTVVVFSGDVGRSADMIMNPPEIIAKADYVVVESTYGDKKHEDSDPINQLGAIVRETAAQGGVTIIPCFAVGRAQTLLYCLYELKKHNKIPHIPIYVDSPMATNVTDLLCQYPYEHRLKRDVCEDVCAVASYIRTPDESKALDRQSIPMIIISASGMLEGGRVLHHLKYFIGDPKNTIVFTGFQAHGTRGAQLLHGADSVKIHGQMYDVKARIVELYSISAHADYTELLAWLKLIKTPPHQVFVTHGEAKAALALVDKIEHQLGWHAVAPMQGDSVVL